MEFCANSERLRPRVVAIVAAFELWLAFATPTAWGQSVSDEIHWTITGQTSVTFDWRGSAPSIRFGLTTSYDREVVAVTPAPLPFSSSGPFREARITGLAENTLYHYSIGGGPDRTFRTPPPRGGSDFVVVAAGDIGDSEAYSEVAALQSMIAAEQPRFFIGLGDLTYGNSHGQAAVDQHFNDVMAWSRDAAYMPAWGNHEWDTDYDDLRNYKGRFEFPNPQTSPGSPSVSCCGEDWYWFDYGNARFIAYPEPWSGAWADWFPKASALMDAAQTDPAIACIVTFGHRPAYSTGNHSPGSMTLRAYLDTLGVRHPKYVLNLDGHDHNYQRSKPQRGVVQITAGFGGSGIYSLGDASWTAYQIAHHGILRLHFTATGIEGRAICGPAGGSATCVQGSAMDEFFIAYPGGGGERTDRAPMVSAPAQVSTTVGKEISIAATASDPDGDAITSLTAESGGFAGTFTTNTANTQGTLWWTASAVDADRTYTVTFAAGNAQTGSAMTTIDVAPMSPAQAPHPTVDARVAAGSDDAEENSKTEMRLTDSALEMVTADKQQIVGLRFTKLALQRGMKLRSAYVQFQASANGTTATALNFRAHATDDAPAFTTSKGNLSKRTTTHAGVSWSPAAWTNGQAGTAQRTPDLRAVVQEIIDRPGWKSGNAIALIIRGSGKRVAVSRDQSSSVAPLLHVEIDSTLVNDVPAEDPSFPPIHGALGVRFVPSPLRRDSKLQLVTAHRGPARVELFDAGGRRARVLLEAEDLEAGTHEFPLSVDEPGAKRLAPGIYFYRVQVRSAVAHGRLPVVR